MVGSGCVFLFLICLYSCHALYEDQVGKFDWKQSFVGRVKFSVIDVKPKNIQRIFVATHNNVVAHLSSSGDVVWRKVFEEGDLGCIHLIDVGKDVITVSGSGPYLVRSWDPETGLLLTETSVGNVGTKDVHWTIDQKMLYHTKRLSDSLEITTYGDRTGTSSTSSYTIKTPWLTPETKCIVQNGSILCITPKEMVHVELSTKGYRSLPFPPTVTDVVAIESIPSDNDAVLLTERNGMKTIVILDEQVLPVSLPQDNIAVVRKTSEGPEVHFIQTKNGEYFVKSELLLSGKPGRTEKKVGYKESLPFGKASSFACLSQSVGDSCFFLIVGFDDALVLINDDEVRFVREEALANVVAVEMIDLPVSDEEAAIEKEFANKEGGILGMAYRRIHSQILQVKNALKSLLGLKEVGDKDQSNLVRDRFGLHRLMLMITNSTKVFGMENENGAIVWHFHLNSMTPVLSFGAGSVPLFIQRTSRHLPHPPICTLIFKQESGLSALYVFNPITGEPLYGGLKKLNYVVKQSMLLPTENSQFIKGLVLLSTSNEVHVFPENTMEVAVNVHRSLYMYTVDVQSGHVQGYAFLLEDNILKVIEVWNLRLSAPIIKLATKNRDERVHSQGRVMSDRSVLYKYLNPHVVVIVTQSPDPVHKSIITVFLVDTVSGANLYSCYHKRALPPLHVVNSENWVLYSYFNEKSKRTEIVALDLYEGKFQRNTTVFSSLSSLLDPLVEKQAYIFPHNILTMRETITEKGITSKHVLVAVNTGSVIEVPWVLFDPRRTPDGREEGVIPYTPDLNLPHEATLTYNHSLASIHGIHTSPSGLESTSLVLIYGLDLFYTRVAPSKTFDVLKDDFEYVLITVVVGALLIAAFASKKIASRKALRLAWK